MLKAIQSLIVTNQFKLFAISSISLFVIGVMGYGVIARNDNNKVRTQVNNQTYPTNEPQGQIAGVATELKPSPTPTTSLIRRVIEPTNTPVPSRVSQPVNHPQTDTNTLTEKTSQPSQNTFIQTSNPVYISQQPTTQPIITPEQVAVIGLEITHDSSKGMIYANKQLKECFITGGKHAVYDTALTPGKGVVGGTTCFVGGESPDWIDVHGYVIDFDGQEKGF